VLAVIGEGLIELEVDDAFGDHVLMAPGGDAGNIAVMAARLGAPARLGGRIGDDPFGARLLAFWRGAGVDVSHVRVDPDANAVTGLYLNAPRPGGGHRFAYWRGGSAGSRLQPGDLGDSFLVRVGLLVVTGVALAVSPSSAAAAQEAVARARAAGARVACVLNHRPALGGDIAALTATARGADLVIGSTEDAAAMVGERDPVALAREVLDVPELVLTDGRELVTAVIDRDVVQQRVPVVPVVNAAGAGDAFAGAYLAQRLAGVEPSAALAWGVAASALSVTRRGCASSYPTLAETTALAHQLLSAA
jgi:2-dehydro-3-deoxygluconokinase